MTRSDARPARRWRALLLSGLFTALVVLLSFGMGRYPIAPGEVMRILWQIVSGQFDVATASEAARVLY